MDLSSETIQNDLNLHYTTRRLQRGKVIEYKWNDELKKGDVHNPTLDFYFYKVSRTFTKKHMMNLDDEIIKLPNIRMSKRNNPLFNVCHDSALFGVDHNTIVTPSPLSEKVSRERAGVEYK